MFDHAVYRRNNALIDALFAHSFELKLKVPV